MGGAYMRHGLAPPPGLCGALLPASASLQLSACSTFHAAASRARERQLRGLRARASVSVSRLSPRERLAHERTFVSPRASGSRPRRRRQRADRAGWTADHGGGRGRRADETASHPGNEKGAGGGAPWQAGAGRGGQRLGRGGPAAGPGSGPPTAGGRRAGAAPLCDRPELGAGGAAPRRPAWGGRQRAAGIPAAVSRGLGIRGARQPASSAGQQPDRRLRLSAGLASPCRRSPRQVSVPVALALDLRSDRR